MLYPASRLVHSACDHADLDVDHVLAQVLGVETLTGLDQPSTKQAGKKAAAQTVSTAAASKLTSHDKSQASVFLAVANYPPCFAKTCPTQFTVYLLGAVCRCNSEMRHFTLVA